MKFSELKAHWAWMLEHMPDDEPVVFPRRAAKKRIANQEKRKRVIFDTDPQTYSEWQAQREAWMLELADNPTLFGHAMLTAMREFDLKGWIEQQESLGDA